MNFTSADLIQIRTRLVAAIVLAASLVPQAHGVHMAKRLPHAKFTTVDGESHLGGLGVATEVLTQLMELGPRATVRSSGL